MNRHLEEYLAYVGGVRSLSVRTVESYRRDLSLYESFLTIPPLEAGVSNIRLFIADLGQRGYQSSSMNRILASVRGFYRYAAHFGLRSDNPSTVVRNLKVPKKMPTFLFAAEAEKFCTAPAKQMDSNDPTSLVRGVQTVALWPLRDTALFTFLYSTGCRVSEAAALTMNDIDPSMSSAIVTGKGNKERKVFISKSARKSLSEYLVERTALLARYQDSGKTVKHLFLSQRAKALSVRGMQFILAHYSDASGTERHLSPHALRHTFATTLISRGADIRVVQELLGHSSISTTQRYTHVTPEQLKKLYHRSHPHG